MANWLRSAITNPHTGEQSSKSIALLLAVFILTLALILLTIAALFGKQIDPVTASALTGIANTLAAVAGGGYVTGKVTGALTASNKPPNPLDTSGD